MSSCTEMTKAFKSLKNAFIGLKRPFPLRSAFEGFRRPLQAFGCLLEASEEGHTYFMASKKTRSLPKHKLTMAGCGTGRWVPVDDPATGLGPLDLASDQSLIQVDMAGALCLIRPWNKAPR